MRRHLGRTLLIMLVGGCAAKSESVRAVAPPTLQLAANQIVIGERVTFAGKDGKPVTTRPGVYRVGTRGADTLELYFGKSTKPYALIAKKASVELTDDQRAAPSKPRAVLRIPNDATRELWLCMPDGTVYGAAGAPEGVRLRGELLTQTAPQELLPTYGGTDATAQFGAPLAITAPAENVVYWNRLEPLAVAWTGGSGQYSVSFVQRVTQRALRNKNLLAKKSASFKLVHVDPGYYDVVVTDRMTGATTQRGVRLVGPARSLAAGEKHTLTIGPWMELGPHDDYILAWGDNTFGQCGTTEDDRVRVERIAVPLARRKGTDAELGHRAVAVATGDFHSLAIETTSRGILAWGHNGYGKLGLGVETTTSIRLPAFIGKPLDRDVLAIAAGCYHSLALKREEGTTYVYAWGKGENCGQGPNGPEACATPVRVQRHDSEEGEPKYLTNIVAIAAGGTFRGHALALDADGGLWGWGTIPGTNTFHDRAVPVVHEGHSGRLVAIEASLLLNQYQFILEGDWTGPTTLYACGMSGPGWEGINPHGGTASLAADLALQFNRGKHLVLPHVVPRGTLPATGTPFWRYLFARGSNESCQLGSGHRTQKTVLLTMPLDVIVTATGAAHSVATAWDWSVPEARLAILAWGDNRSGQVGGYSVDQARPRVQYLR